MKKNQIFYTFAHLNSSSIENSPRLPLPNILYNNYSNEILHPIGDIENIYNYTNEIQNNDESENWNCKKRICIFLHVFLLIIIIFIIIHNL